MFYLLDINSIPFNEVEKGCFLKVFLAVDFFALQYGFIETC